MLDYETNWLSDVSMKKIFLIYGSNSNISYFAPLFKSLHQLPSLRVNLKTTTTIVNNGFATFKKINLQYERKTTCH